MLHFLLLPFGYVVVPKSLNAPLLSLYFLFDDVGTFGRLTLLVPPFAIPVRPAVMRLLMLAKLGFPIPEPLLLAVALQGPVNVFDATLFIPVLDVACLQFLRLLMHSEHSAMGLLPLPGGICCKPGFSGFPFLLLHVLNLVSS